MTTASRPQPQNRPRPTRRSRTDAPLRAAVQQDTPPQVPYIPNVLTNDWIHGFHRDTIDQSLRHLGRVLIHERQLPNFYFRQALIEEGVDPIRAARWDPSRWVSPNGKVNITDYDYQLLALTAFLKISRYLTQEPRNETYNQAISRLKRAFQDLLDRDFSRAEMAKRLNLNPKTVGYILRDRNTTRTRICPWEIIHKIEATDWTPPLRHHRRSKRFADPPTPHSITDNEVSHSRAKDRAAQKQAIQLRRGQIAPEQPCWKCGSSHNHLTPAGPPDNDLQELACRICGSSNYIHLQSTKS